MNLCWFDVFFQLCDVYEFFHVTAQSIFDVDLIWMQRNQKHTELAQWIPFNKGPFVFNNISREDCSFETCKIKAKLSVNRVGFYSGSKIKIYVSSMNIPINSFFSRSPLLLQPVFNCKNYKLHAIIDFEENPDIVSLFRIRALLILFISCL